MYVITFYSFKGGVGRTMALVNTAAELARRGRKVLLVDFDLEAPGLSTYDLLRPQKPHPGIVEYVTDFRHTRRSPLVTDFIYPREGRPVGKKGGKLWVMPAGRRGDAEYRHMLNALNWRTLYQDEEGFLLFEDTRMQWEAELHPDYVLIDARTGHTDIEGICTRQLANAVVMVFYPNEQNLAGLGEVCRDVRAENELRRDKEKIKLHLVASNVPDLDDEHGVLHRHLLRFRDELQIPSEPIVLHRNETLAMLDQPIFVIKRPRSRLAREYRRLVRSLLMDNPEDREGTLLWLRQMERMPSQAAPGYRTWQFDKHRLESILVNFWNDAEVLAGAARCLASEGRFRPALQALDQALELHPALAAALIQRAICRGALGDCSGAAEDLLAYLHVPGVEEHDRLRALRELKVVSPEEFNEGISWESLRNLDEEGWDRLREGFLLPTDDRGYPSMQALHRKFLEENDLHWVLELDDLGKLKLRIILEDWAPQDTSGLDPSSLVKAKRWDEATRLLECKIKLLEREVTNQSASEMDNSHDGRLLRRIAGQAMYRLAGAHMELALVHWAKTGSMPEDRCRLGLEKDAETSAFVRIEEEAVLTPRPAYYQLVSLALWRLGQVEEALRKLDAAEAEIKRIEYRYRAFGTQSPCLGEYRTESYWRWGSRISSDVFLADCDAMRRMIRGAALLPPFLKEGSSVARGQSASVAGGKGEGLSAPYRFG